MEIDITEVIREPGLFRFLRTIRDIELPRNVLDIGAGGRLPPLAAFRALGYETCGIEISEEHAKAAMAYGKKHNLDLDIRLGDMRDLPLDDESFSFVFTQHSLCHLSKKEHELVIKEISRVMRPGGMCFVDFMSTECPFYGDPETGEMVGEGEFALFTPDGKALHSFFKDGEPDDYLIDFEIMQRVKTKVENVKPNPYTMVRLEYIVRKL
jgi:SAM-dependent methyltransferase